ncbi:MAG: RNase adapter RapZ [Pseudomonadota bacterium]|nr:RNase adapter RapZ [Pseudomonadota bacterium]MEC8281033.1 RNase adapter RapZ [Pseudomonadota bacterium]
MSVNSSSEAPAPPVEAVLVTGLSGAGRTTVLKILEDHGRETVDNLPQGLLPALLAAPSAAPTTAAPAPLAIGLDVRARGFDAGALVALLDGGRGARARPLRMVFLDCDDETLIKRFTETRRTHPLAVDRPVADGIAVERRALAPLHARADLVIDTSEMSVVDLRHAVTERLCLDGTHRLRVQVVSFAYRAGLPRDADLVFDVRFLSNPHYDPVIGGFDGRDARVAAHIRRDPAFDGFLTRLTDYLAPLLPLFEAEGKSYLTVAVGCTGGRHRSVLVAETVAKWLMARGLPVTVRHRELAKAAVPAIADAPLAERAETAKE